jgi:hypothetical protein
MSLKSNMDEGKKLSLNDISVIEAAGYKVASYPGMVRYVVVRTVREALNQPQNTVPGYARKTGLQNPLYKKGLE